MTIARTAVLLSAAILSCPLAAAGVSLSPLAQTREVEAIAFAAPSMMSDSDAAPDFAPFDSGALAKASSPSAFSDSAAAQTSQIAAQVISADGSAAAAISINPFLPGPASASGASRCMVAFLISEECVYELRASIAATLTIRGGPSARVAVELLGPTRTMSSSIVELDPSGKAGVEGGLFGYDSGLLEPGEYTLVAEAAAAANGGPEAGADASFDITLTVMPRESCATDINGDGVVNVADLSKCLGAWGSADPASDVNHDGVVNATDLSNLLGSWGPCSSARQRP